MPRVEIYTKAFCGYCVRAKRLLEAKGVDFHEYDITPNTSGPDLVEKLCIMGGKAVFKFPNYLTANINKQLRDENAIFKCHFDQRCRLNNVLSRKAYYGLDVVHLLSTLDNNLMLGNVQWDVT